MKQFTFSLIIITILWCTPFTLFAQENIDPSKLKDGKDVRVVNGVRILYLDGTHKENGVKIGKSFRSRIHFLKNGYMKTFFTITGGKEKTLIKAKKMEKFIPKRFIEEMQGIATGSGISYDDILILNCFMEIYKIGCSNHVAWGNMTKDGKLIHARNLDFPDKDKAHANLVILAYAIKGKKKILTITWPGVVGVLTGMNEDKLCLTIDELFHFGRKIQSMPYHFFYRMLLEDCKTLAEAEAKIKKRKANTANIIVVSSGLERTAFEAEVVPNKGAAFVKPEGNWLTVTNNAITTEFRQKDCWRRKLALEYMKANKGQLDTKKMKKLLKKTNMGILNILAVVMEPEEMKMEIAYEKIPATQGPWHTLKWSDCFKAKENNSENK